MFERSDSLRHRLRLARLRLVGGRVPTRTHDGSVVLKPTDARALSRGHELERLRRTGLVLGGEDHGSDLPAHGEFADEPGFVARARALHVGRRAPNPLYAHLFAAFEFASHAPALGLPDLESQMGRWLPWADPLEERPIAFGLTPYRTCTQLRQNIHEHLAREPLPTATGYEDVKLRNDAAALATTRKFLRRRSGLPTTEWADPALRELWVLLFGHESLFLTLS